MISGQNPKIEMLPIGDIDIDAESRLRPVFEAGVESLIASIEQLGLIKDAIAVRKKRRASGTSLVLLAGGHRLEAAKRLGWDAIPARVFVDITDADARLMEIDDNLAGKALEPLDQARFLAERKRVYEAAHPEAKHGGDRKSNAYKDQVDNLAVCSFAKATAEATGLSERKIFRLVAAGGVLSTADYKALRGAPMPIRAGDVYALAKVTDPGERTQVINALVSGGATSVAAACKAGKPKVTMSSADIALRRLLDAWARAPQKVRRAFVDEKFADLSDLVSDEHERRER